ncbi:hypothetical protein D3C73_1071470 [compost metagenome]
MADRIHHTLKCRRIRDAHAVVIVRSQAACGQARFDLRAGTVNQHQAHAKAVQQHQVVDDVAEVGVLDTVAGQHDDKGAVAVGIDIRRSVTKPINVVGHEPGACNKEQPKKWAKHKTHNGLMVIVGTGLATRELSS